MVPKPASTALAEQTDSQLAAVGTSEGAKTKGSTNKRGKKRARPLDSEDDGDDVEMLDSIPSSITRASRRKIRKVYTENEMSGSDSATSEQGNDTAYVPGDFDNEETIAEGPPSRRVKAEEEEIRLPPASAADTFPIDIDEEEKPKMAMTLSYKGHHIPGRYLCVIVEPYPPLAPELAPRAESVVPPEVRFRPTPAIPQLRDPSEIPSSSRAGSVRLRSETPLFLPEHDDDDGVRESSPRFANRQLPPVPHFDGSARGQLVDAKKENAGGLLAFSQALTNVRHEHEGSDSDEDYLRGDADENQRILE